MDEGRKRMSERVYKQTEEGDRDSENLWNGEAAS